MYLKNIFRKLRPNHTNQ